MTPNPFDICGRRILCRTCEAPLPVTTKRGRPREYCSGTCRDKWTKYARRTACRQCKAPLLFDAERRLGACEHCTLEAAKAVGA